MRPERFPEQTAVLQPPGGWEEECGVLAVYQDGERCISRWRPSWAERVRILLGEPVWLWVWSGRSQPPVAVTVESPFAVVRS